MAYTTDSVSPALAERLAKVCGQFGADNDHLVLVAARTAHRLLKEAGATWPDAFQPTLPAPEPKQQPYSAHASGNHRAIAQFCLDEAAESRGGLLTSWEIGFLNDILKFQRISPKQRAILERLYDKVLAP
jgi:hypothetical protein